MNIIKMAQMLEFSQKGDDRGHLVIVEGMEDIPFDIKRIFYICRVGLGIEPRNSGCIGFGRYGDRSCGGSGDGIMESGLLSVELRDDWFEEWDVVFLDLADVAFVGDLQPQGRAVEFERDDGLEPLAELLFGGLGLDAVQAVLPHIAVCLLVVDHDGLKGCF